MRGKAVNSTCGTSGELHLRDVLGIIRVSGAELDERYIVQWADRLGLGAVWERVRQPAG
jgi:hypothetical protein